MTQTKAELLQTRHQGDIRLGDADSSHYVGFKAPATVGTSLVWTLPAADGTANYLLKTDGSGNLGWVADSSTDSTKMPLAGGTFTGDVTFTGAAANIVFDKSDNALEFADNTKALFGTGADMWLIHDGTNSTLQSETGNLRVRTVGQFQLTKSSTENMLIAIPDGAVELYHNNVKRVETTAAGAQMPSSNYFQFNAASSNAWAIGATTGAASPTGEGTALQYHHWDNSSWSKVSFQTRDGVGVPDNKKLLLGDSSDLQIYHDGNNSKITESGTGILAIGGSAVHIEAADHGEILAKFIDDGAVELYYDNTKRAETTNTGFNVVGALTVNGAALASGLSSDAQKNTVGGTNAGNSFTGTDANDNTLIGYDAGTGITTGDKNTSLGVRANETGTTGSANTAIGYEALNKLTTGGNNVAVGNNAGFELATGGRNVAIGAQCLKESTAGTGTVAIGWQAAQENRGNYNVAIGYVALKGTGGVTGYNNVAIGLNAGTAVTSGYSNVFIGDGAGSGAQTSMLNIAIGPGAGSSLQHVGSNTFVGRNAGAGVTTGGPNLLLGWNAGQSASPSGAITTGSNIVCLGGDNVTDLYCQDTSISSSDSRDKADITNFTHGLSWINKLNPVTYRWDKRTWYNEYNEDGSLKTEVTSDGSKKRARQHIGFLAQDVLAIEQADGFASKKDDMLVVNLNEDDSAYGLKYERLVPVLVNAIKELSTEVNTLKTKVAALEAA